MTAVIPLHALRATGTYFSKQFLLCIMCLFFVFFIIIKNVGTAMCCIPACHMALAFWHLANFESIWKTFQRKHISHCAQYTQKNIQEVQRN